MKANWTPGPWIVTDDGYVVAGEKYIHEPNNLGKKCCGGMVISDEVLANARLIAACPDLLEALKAIIEECPNPKLPYGIRVVELARAAIGKATGEEAKP